LAHARPHRKGIEASFIANIVLHRHDDDLGQIDRGPSADSHDEIGLRLLCVTSDFGSLLAGRVLRNSVEGRGMLVAERAPDFLDLVGLGVQGSAGDEEDALCAKSLGLFADSFRGGFAIDDTVNCRKIMYTGFAYSVLPPDARQPGVILCKFASVSQHVGALQRAES